MDLGNTIDRVYESNIRYSINIFMNRDVNIVSRQVYNTFMLLSDIGGIYGLLLSFASTLLGYVNFQKSSNILVSKLFTTEKEETRTSFVEDFNT